MPKPKQLFLILAILMALMLSCSLFTRENSPAAGCNKSLGMGGCFGTTAIIDLSVEPAVECLEVEGDNCLGGLLDVTNSCQESFILEGIEIPPSAYLSFELVEDKNGQISLIEVRDFYTEYTPDENKSVVLIGMLGDQEIEVRFTKTAPLCER